MFTSKLRKLLFLARANGSDCPPLIWPRHKSLLPSQIANALNQFRSLIVRYAGDNRSYSCSSKVIEDMTSILRVVFNTTSHDPSPFLIQFAKKLPYKNKEYPTRMQAYNSLIFCPGSYEKAYNLPKT